MTTTTTTDKTSRLAAARAYIERVRAEREAAAEKRKRKLPAAICRVCGTNVPAGTGTRGDDPNRRPDAMKHAPQLAEIEKLGPLVDFWRRTCDDCTAADAAGELEARAVSTAVGFPVAISDALAVVGLMRRTNPVTGVVTGMFPTAEVSGRWSGRPWGHLTPEDRKSIRATLDDVVGDTLPKRHKSGACGLCGARAALVWWVGPSSLRWPGSDATVHICDTCAEVWNRRGGPDDGDDLRRVVVELATGYAVPFGLRAPEGVRPFAASAAADPEGLDEPWTFSVGIRDLQREIWTARPEVAPAAMREQAEAWHREEEAERAEASRAEAEAAQAAGW
ncbi:hypothetical protein IF188_08255 [Microbacterium sp. NEAU-LLC]|uniref:HNH endonuclease n=1 Tax=Microbacterium helvum TaxID=2773713 RepID=A0ABR8NND8_9MICO|nr:hypothetical protein [Microbacterium helvum]MBD3941684.1 hypothetical protein [Microbacterium helvum]